MVWLCCILVWFGLLVHLVGFVVLVLFDIVVWCLLSLYSWFGFRVVCGFWFGYVVGGGIAGGVLRLWF